MNKPPGYKHNGHEPGPDNKEQIKAFERLMYVLDIAIVLYALCSLGFVFVGYYYITN